VSKCMSHHHACDCREKMFNQIVDIIRRNDDRGSSIMIDWKSAGKIRKLLSAIYPEFEKRNTE
jgi:hypothetical protein